MLSKLITYGENRKDCTEKMMWALSQYVVLGVTSNIYFLKQVLQHPEFIKGNTTTHFIDNYFKDWTMSKDTIPVEALISLAIYDSLHSKKEEIVRFKEADPHSPWKHMGRWRISGED